MQRERGIKERDVGGESGARDESSCSVTAAPFTRPVSLVFVTSDVSIKTEAVTKNKPTSPPPAICAATTTPRAPSGSAPPFTHDPALDSLCLFTLLPLTRTHKPEGPIVPGATLHL